MLKAIETENVIQSVIRDIMRQCSNVENVTEQCAAYMIKLMVLNPDYGFVDDQPLRRDDIQYLVDLCVARLSKQRCPALEAIKMQVYYESNHISRGDMIAQRQEEIKDHAAQLEKEIITTIAKTRDDLEVLYRKIVVYSMMFSGLGSPTYIPALKEATAAMQSVFPPTELGQFMALSQRDKEQQIQELSLIMTGIRLFNRDCHKGGEGIEDLPNLLQRALVATTESLQSYLQELINKINMMTTALDHIIKEGVHNKKIRGKKQKNLEENEDSKSAESENKDDNEEEKLEEEEDVDFIKGCLTVARQQEVYIRKLLAETDVSNIKLKELLDLLQQRLLLIHDQVRFRTAIPTVQIFPQFMGLAQIWFGLEDEMVVLSGINKLSMNLKTYTKELDHMNIDLLKDLIGDSPILSDKDRLEATTGLMIPHEKLVCEVVDPTKDVEHLPIQCLGFCPWALVIGQGVLIPGNPNMGLCHWHGNYYIFSSLEAATCFGEDPERYINATLKLVRIRPELIGLLQLWDQVTAQKIPGETAVKLVEPVVTREIDMQTELHPIPTFIDPTYTWNTWELKKRAIQMANIVNSATHSTQTVKSNFRLSLGLQTSPAKNVSCQTKRDNSANVSQKRDFIFGLRGRKDKQQHVIDLTFPQE